MSQFYTDPTRESDPHALPDAEVFYMSQAEIDQVYRDNGFEPGDDDAEIAFSEPGFYYWPCFPGCLPDGDAIGPFPTEAEALDDARENYVTD